MKTSSGGTAVQIVHSSWRGSRNIEHLGSAYEEGELGALKAAVRQRLTAGQGELDLGLPVKVLARTRNRLIWERAAVALGLRAQLLEYFPGRPLVLYCASMTLRLVLAAYGLENVRPYRIGAGRNNEHWYVGAGLVLRRYGPSRSDAAIGYEHAIVGQLRDRGWPVAAPIPSAAGRLVVVDDGRRYSLFPRLAGRRGRPARPRQPRELGRLLGRLHRDLAAVSAAAPPDAFPRILEMPADPAWQRLDALDDSVLAGLIRRKLAEVRTAAGSAASGRPGVQLVHGDWHDGNILYQGGTVSGILDFDFAHPDLPLVDVAIAALIPDVGDSAQIAAGYFGARLPAEHELDLIATVQRARALGHVAFFTGRHADGDHGAAGQIRLGVDLLLRAEQRWPALRAAILSTTG